MGQSRQTVHKGSDTAARPAGMAAVVACFVLSGFAALLYQTAWLREFSLVFGTSELAVATVLAAYMGGLALGAGIASRFAYRVTRPVLVYGLLEAGIAFSALAVPLLLAGGRALYAWTLGDLPMPPDANTSGQSLFYLVGAFVVLAVPTGLMGATLPLLIQYAVRADRDVGPGVALLYAMNTLGAVAGTLVAAFLLLPALGLTGTLWVGGAVNALIFAIAASLARFQPRIMLDTGGRARRAPPGFFESCVRPVFSTDLRAAFAAQRVWILPLMMISGAVAFTYEVLWTRMLAHVLGGSIYAFATMLAAFLGGITLGGVLAGRVADTAERATTAFAVAQACIAILSMGVYAWMGPLIPDQRTAAQLVLYAVAVMFPATVFIGATFPLAVRILASDEREATAGTARIYSWNTFGAIAGAVIAGFYLIPGIGFEGAVRVAVCINLGLALWAVLFMESMRPVVAAIFAIVFLAAIIVYQPARPDAVVSTTGFEEQGVGDARELFYGVGRSATVLLVAEPGEYVLRSNGLPQASVTVKGAPPTTIAEQWLTALAVTARPQTRDMLVVGFGGGVALEGVPASVDQVDVVELEPEIINANRVLEGMRNVDLLSQSRIHVVINDGRNALRLTSKKYDAIVSQPSHPWTSGASHLFTREFFAEVKAHLNTGGVMVQWMSSAFVDQALLRTLAATLLSEFENVRLYQPTAQILMFLASDEPLALERSVARSGEPFSDDIMHYSRMGLNGPEDLFAAMAMDEAGVRHFAEGAPVSTDNFNLMATESRSRADGLGSADLMVLFEPYDPLLDSRSWVHRDFADVIDYGYLARRMLSKAQHGRVAALVNAIPDASKRLEIQGLLYRSVNQGRQADAAFRAAVAEDGTNQQAAYMLLVDRLDDVARGESTELIQAIAAGLTGSAAAVLRGREYSAQENWAALAALDPELSRTRITDAWYQEAARLRGAWRTSVAGESAQYVVDALRIADRALLLGPQQDLFRIRAAAALRLGNDDAYLESARYFSAYIRTALLLAERQGSAPGPGQLLQMRNDLRAVRRELDRGLTISDRERVTAAAMLIDDLLTMVDQMVSGAR